MSDYSELKRLATRIVEVQTSQDVPISKLFDDFEAAACPETILTLIAENEALRKDAERYRWLREYHNPESEAPFICQQRLMFGKLYYAGPLVAVALDQEVDSAMGKGEQS